MDAATLYPEILRPYDARANPLPPPTQGICDGPVYTICVNEFWWAHISGQIARLLYRDAWEGTDEEIQTAIDSISKILDVGRPTMGCGCGCGDLPLVRINESGVYQESDDGGITWHDAPTHDPRNSIPRIPAYPSPSTDGAKCAYADSVVHHFKDGFIDLLEEGQTAEEIGSIITAIAAEVFGPITGPIGWLVPAFFAIATAIVAIGNVVVRNAFTTDFWNQLRCLIFNNMNDDGSFTNAQIDTIYAGIPGGAITTTILHSWIAAIGATGMTNAAHLAMGSTATDCSACAGCTPELWTLFDDWIGIGQTVTYGSDYVEVVAKQGSGGGPYYIILKTDNIADCCQLQTHEIVENHGDFENMGYTLCNNAVDEYVPGALGDPSITGVCINHLYATMAGPSKVRFVFAAC